MEIIKVCGALIAAAILLTSCDGMGSGLSGPSDVHRGESDAVNPARNVYVTCEKDKSGNNVSVVTNITNNCNKNNNSSTNSGGGEG